MYSLDIVCWVWVRVQVYSLVATDCVLGVGVLCDECGCIAVGVGVLTYCVVTPSFRGVGVLTNCAVAVGVLTV